MLSDLYGWKDFYLWNTAVLVGSLLACGAAWTLLIPLDDMNQLMLLGTGFSQITDKVLLTNLLEGARAGLLSALRFIFLLGAGIMAVSFALNLFLSDRPTQERF